MKQLLLSFLVAVALLLGGRTTSMAQTAVSPSSGDGSLGNPYLIATLSNLYWIADQTNNQLNSFSGKYFIQTADIDASSTSTWFSGAGWKPIYGDDSNSIWFLGSYDGQGHTISGLYIHRLSAFNIGFFGGVFGGTIKNLGLINVSITGGGDSNGAYVGGLIGNLYGGATVNNCYTTGSVSGYDMVGGLIGGDDGSGGANTVINCHSSCTVSVTNSEGGGLIGNSSSSTVSNCYATGSITGASAVYNAGLIGLNNSNVSSCYATGASNGRNQVAGLLGCNYGNVTNCYATGSANGSEVNNGGLIGYNTGTISNCYAIGLATGSAGSVGGFVGVNGAGGNIQNNCFWNTTVKAAGYGGNTGTFSAIGKTTTQLQTATTFTGASWSSSIWNIANSTYPTLWEFPALTTTAIDTYNTSSATLGGNITTNGGVTVTERGVVYSSTPITPVIGGAGVTKDANGTGIGIFSKSIGSLSASTLYYVCAYAINSVGTNYGSVKSFTTTSTSNIIYVDAAKADDSGDGLSWTNAKKTLQAALNLAVSGKDIWVKAGTYKPSYDYGLGGGSRYFHFRMINGVAIYGGFAGTETAVSQRTSFGVGQTNETILSGDIGTIGDNSDNCYHVFYHPDGSNLTNSAILDGFTVTKGNANIPSGFLHQTCGGGMYNGPSSTSLSGTWSPTIRNTTFDGNNVSGFGGGIFNLQSSPIFSNVTISNNTAGSNGGGIGNSGSSPTLINVTISNNSSGNYGGGFYQEKSMTFVTPSNSTLTNVVIKNNIATTYGGGIEDDASTITLNNVTISNNSSATGGGYDTYGSTAVINNCIIWGNTSTIAGNQIANDAGTITLNYSCYSNGTSDVSGTVIATNNDITSDPKFANLASSDFRLYSNSPCADTGNDAYNSETYDIRGFGFGRKLNKTNHSLTGTIDMGAYEYKEGTDPLAVSNPTVTSVSVPSNATYIAGQNLDFTVNFSAAVNVVTTGGTPYIPITLNTGGTVNASYLSGTGTTAIVFRYTIASGNLDADGVSVGSSITANGGTLKSGGGTDATLALNSVGSTTGVLVDAVAPTVSSINRGTPSFTSTNASSVTFGVTFSESVKNVDVSDFTLTISGTVTGNISSVSASSGTSINVTINSITGDGTLRLDSNSSGTGITDNAGNAISGGFTSGQAYTIDKTAPTVSSINRLTPSTTPTNLSSVIYRVTFSESVSGVDVSDFSLTATSASTGSIASVSAATGTTVDVTVNSISGDGTLRLDLNSSGTGITDNAGNAISGGFTSGQTYTIDKTAPTVSISSTASDPTNISPIPVTITFSKSVTGFVVGDITVTNGTAGTFAGSGTTYTANITPSGQGVVTVNVAGSVAQDAVGNNNTAATELSRTFDSLTPSVSSVSSTTANGTYKQGDAISITVILSEAVDVFGTPTIALNSGGSASFASGSGTSTLTFSYTVGSGQNSADLDYSATSSLALAGGTIKDAAGNDATLALPTVGGASSLGGQKNIVIGIVPAVTTQAVSTISAFTASGNGNITDLGFPNPTAYGVCWNTTGAPTTSDSKANNGAASATGAFTASITGLSATTVYYVRAYATNSAGTIYGNEVSFTTGVNLNLLDNPGAELDYTSWTVTNGGSGWGIDGSAYSGSKDWASSYGICTLSQTVNLIAKGYSATDLDLSMPIYASAYVATSPLKPGNATIKVELLNASDAIINTYYVCSGGLAQNLPWTKKETLISGYSSGLRKIRYTITGTQTGGNWTGQYGPKFDETELSFRRVTTKPATQLELTSATLNSMVFTLGLSSTVKFEYGTASGVYTKSVDVTDISGTTANVNVSGLNQGTTYYARAVMTNSTGTFYGDEISFKTKIQLTISDPVIASKSYNGDTNATVSTLGTLSGKEGSDDVSVVPTAIFDNKDVGTGKTVTISYSLSGLNKDKYAAPGNSVLATGEITQKALTITAEDKSKVYDGAVYSPFTVAYSGFITGESASVLGGTLAFGGTATTAINVGTNYVITPSGLTSGNYDITFVAGKLDIGRKALTITAEDKSKCYDGAVYSGNNTISTSGFALGDDLSKLNGSLTFGGTANGAFNVGSYTIIPGGLTSGNYTITFQNGTLNINSLPVPTITGPVSVCAGNGKVTYSTESGMTGYTWTASGTVTPGTSSSAIEVTWNLPGSHIIVVNYTNPNGCIAKSSVLKNVTVNPGTGNAGNIIGTAELCAGTQGVVYSTPIIPNADSYVWTLPAGATIAGGDGTASINVNFKENASSGSIFVYGKNLCSTGKTSPAFPVTVNPIPETPVLTIDGNILKSNALDGNQWYFQDVLIPRATDMTYQATHAGKYWAEVMLHGCRSAISNFIDLGDIEDGHFGVYPIPNNGKFTAMINTPSPETVTISVYNKIGKKIYELSNISVFGKLETVIDLGSVSSGIYIVEFKNSLHSVTRKMLINK